MTDKIRIIFEIGCTAPQECFVPEWDDIPAEYQELIKDQGGLPCEGTGSIGLPCVKPSECRWADWDGDWHIE